MSLGSDGQSGLRFAEEENYGEWLTPDMEDIEENELKEYIAHRFFVKWEHVGHDTSSNCSLNDCA